VIVVAAMIWALRDQRNLKNVHKIVQKFTTVPETSNVTKECQNGRRRIIAETPPPSVSVKWQISLVLTKERTRRIGTSFKDTLKKDYKYPCGTEPQYLQRPDNRICNAEGRLRSQFTMHMFGILGFTQP